MVQGMGGDDQVSAWSIATKVAGVTFEGRQAVAALVAPGDWLRVVFEPHNPHDANACGVWRVDASGVPLAGGQVGFLPREVAKDVAPMLADFAPWEVFAHVTEVVGGGELSIGLKVSLRRRVSIAASTA